jgi:type I restriction-modification system DNA methylase subunit
MSSKKLQKNDCPKCIRRFQSIQKMQEHLPNCKGENSQTKKKTDNNDTSSILNQLTNELDQKIENKNLIEVKSDKKEVKNKSNKKKNEKPVVNQTYLRYPLNKIIFSLNENENNNDEKKRNKEYILNKIKDAHDYLYRAENLDGEKSKSDVMNFLFLRILSDKISDKQEYGKIDLLNKEYYLNYYELEDESDQQELETLFSYLRDINNLADVDQRFLRSDDNKDQLCALGNLFTMHPVMKQIYREKNFIKSKNGLTIKTLIKNYILTIDLDKLYENEDIIGDIFEYFVNKYNKKGSLLGQFFTPRILMILILEFMKEELIKETSKGNEYKIYDSCMGTAGWLVSAYNKLKDSNNNILLSGGEVEEDTFKLGLMNLIMTQRKAPHNVRCRSSLTYVDNEKYDLILTNPPFKSELEFNNIENNFQETESIKLNDIYELKDNDSPIQFLELDYFKLKENGICIIVLPYGELFFCRDKKYVEIREKLINKFDITDILTAPNGIFTHTKTRTCVVIFKKNNKGTSKIRYSEINVECNEIKLITEITKEDIMNEPTRSLYPNNYLNDNIALELYNNTYSNIRWFKIGDLFELKKGSIQSSKVEEIENGEYSFINLSKTQDFKKIDSYSLDGENLFISNTSPLGLIQYYNGKCEYSNLLHHFKLKDGIKEELNLEFRLKYIYYFLNDFSQHIEKVYDRGSNNKIFDVDNFYRFLIPIIPIEDQDRVIYEKDSSDKKFMIRKIEMFYELIGKEKIFLNHKNKSKVMEWIDNNNQLLDNLYNELNDIINSE